MRPDEYAAYSVVFEAGPLTQTDLAERLGMAVTTVADYVRTMVERRHLRKRPHPADQRAALLSLTPEGIRAHRLMEGIGFSGGQTARVFEVAKRLGLPVKLHADQLSNLGGATLAARYGALSADHLEHTDEAGAAAMAKVGTVAVLLPGAFYFIRETRLPPVELFRKHRVPIAIATDCNPGSSPLTSLLLAIYGDDACSPTVV